MPPFFTIDEIGYHFKTGHGARLKLLL